MSDVSGIPNLGFGGGNFFAPQFSYNPQMSAGQASAAYMPAENYAQNVTNNLFASGGGFGRETNYYSQLAANQLSGLTPNTFNMTNAGTGQTISQLQQGGASPYQTSPNVFDTGASSFAAPGAGGIDWSAFSPQASPYQSSPNVFSSGASGFQNSGAGLDWSNLFNGSGGGRQDPYPNMSMPGGLGMPASSPSGAQPIDWSNIFGGGGGARADPAPGMAMPGGLNAPMSFPQPTQEVASEGKSSASPPFNPNGSNTGWGNAPSPTMPSSQALLGYNPNKTPDTSGDPFPGMSMPGGLNSPMTAPEPGASFGERFDALGGDAPGAPRTYDFAPMFEGGGGGFGTGGTESQTYGKNAGSLGGNVFDYIQDPSATKEAPGPSAEDMAAQGRAKLAELMGDPKVAAETAKTVEAPFDQPSLEEFQKGGPFDQPSLEEFQKGQTEAARPPDKVDMSLQGRVSALRDTLKKELDAQGLHMTSDYRGPEHELYRPGSQHSNALAFDTRAQTPAQADAAMGKLRELFGDRGMVEGRDYKFIDEVRSPIAGITQGAHLHTTLTPEGMQRYQESAYDVNAGQVIPRPPMSIPASQGGVPLPSPRPAEADIPLETRPGVNQGQEITPPPADIPDPRVSGGGFNAIDAAAPTIAGSGFNAIDAAAKHTGLELARANIDTPIEKIAMERGGQKAVDQVSSMAIGQTPRQLMQSYGGLFMSRAEPLFQSLGITRQDFEKAIAMPQTQQDIKMRFGEGGDFGPYPAYTGPEAALGGGFPDFRQSTNIEDRRGMPDAPFGVPGGMPSSQDLLGYTPQQWSAADYPASFNERFGGEAAAPEPATSMRDFQSPEQGYGSFQGAASPENRLEAQRAGFAASIRDNPEKSLQLAARLYSEDQNNPATRQAILETMLNAQQASGRDPLNPKYYPGNTQQYRDALAKLSSNNDLLNKIYQEMETPFSGSNRANYATDWASGGVAANERKYATPTWTSPSNEQFFLKDIGNDWTGQTRAIQNQKWYQTTSGRAR